MNWKLLLGLGLAVVFGIVGIVSLGTGSTIPSVAFADLPKRAGERVELYGKLDRTTIRSIRGANLVSFELLEEKDGRLTGRRVAVLYDNPAVGLPANFPAASHARASGTYDPTQGKFIADTVYTKCPSKYQEDQLDVEARTAVERWRQATGAQAKPGQ